jgi:hypothetical protein
MTFPRWQLIDVREGSLAATLTSAETTPNGVLNYAAGLGTSIKGDAPMSDQKLNIRKEQP